MANRYNTFKDAALVMHCLYRRIFAVAVKIRLTLTKHNSSGTCADESGIGLCRRAGNIDSLPMPLLIAAMPIIRMETLFESHAFGQQAAHLRIIARAFCGKVIAIINNTQVPLHRYMSSIDSQANLIALESDAEDRLLVLACHAEPEESLAGTASNSPTSAECEQLPASSVMCISSFCTVQATHVDSEQTHNQQDEGRIR